MCAELTILGSQGGDKYQQAFYVFEELAQAPATSSVRSLVSQAVAELHLGRTEEAQAALEEAMKKEPGYAEAIANLLVLSVVTGKDPKELTRCAPYIYLLSRSHANSRTAPCKRRLPNIPSSRTWWRRASCLTRRQPSTRPRWRRRWVRCLRGDD